MTGCEILSVPTSVVPEHGTEIPKLCIASIWLFCKSCTSLFLGQVVLSLGGRVVDLASDSLGWIQSGAASGSLEWYVDICWLGLGDWVVAVVGSKKSSFGVPLAWCRLPDCSCVVESHACDYFDCNVEVVTVL